ncbi:FAD-binding protein, partial [candidate division KSB1 bacterium]|nr:FAD-binding protein [candidate division KSB1 bacterium]NIR68418.1 FAD-binding protein [candidate division KSB1 bacterium]NIS27095.1 FAD-binding protein [candidate division KSB1 bacterium]NIT73949.1 FAD-binding protein [candidate division KSB1 bacterium]NIU27839.1 FAD-binding protein [candidate division KSB1 bacterium]
MKFNQDDATLETDPQVETSSQSPSNHERQDVRRVIARDLPLEAFFDGGREQTFASLGRVSATPEEVLSWQLHPDKRQTIERLIISNSNGKTPDLEKAGISPADILAFAAQGSKPTASKLEEANQLWWKLRENEPLWRSQCSQQKPSFLERLQERRARKVIDKIIAELDFDERESSTLFKTERFSRRTVYARDYAVIPKKLRALFKMVPDLIFAPRTSAQLQRFLAYASEHKINVAPRGRGTWALGGALLTKGGVVLELASFEKKIEVDPKQQKITVSASVDFQEAEEALNRDGLTLKARPSNKYGVIAGFLSVGEPLQGGLGLNAYGIGHIRNCVESIRVVTSRGEEKSIKNDDPDFPYYFGTNGRYGIITEVILEAAKKPAKHHPVALRFESAKNAFEFLLGFRKDVQSGYLEAHPVHIEFYGKDYLDEIKKIKSAQDPSITVNLISPESIKRNTPTKDAVLFVFYDKEDSEAFLHYVEERDGCGLASQSEASELWDERFSPMKLRRKGDLLTAEVILPLDKVQPYLKQVTQFASKLGLKILPVAYILDFNEALVLPQFITDRRRRFQYYRHFSLIPVLARRAIKGFHGRPYGYGIWFSGLARRAMGHELFQDLTQAKKRLDPKGILNPGKLSEIGSRLWNSLGTLLLHERAVDTLDRLLQFQGYLSCFKKFREVFLSNKAYSYFQERGDAMHRCIKCSACMICPLAQIWEKSGDPKLKKDAIYITPRYKMEYMQQHLYEGKKLSQEDVDRFVLCFRCGVAERETVCPISDMLLTVEESESTPCEKKLPTYDDFEAQLRQEGYDVDGAIQRYMDILKTHPGVAHAMQDVLGKYRIPKTGDLTVLQPKTDFAIYKVNVDENRCINCGKCGDEHTTSQRGFWDPRYPRKMVSLDDLLREMHGKIPENWFSDRDGPIPAKIKEQGQSNGEFVHFRNPADSDQGHHHCNGCLYCVIECPVDAIRVSINDYYAELAGEDFTREDIRRLNEEARTGGVPTSGTGSTGVFGGKGFDRFMFDFSVIVRPTRDGIREAIDIGVNLGRKPLFHLFEDARRGDKFPKMRTRVETLDLPTPILLELPLLHGRSSSRDLIEVFGRCAQQEDTVVILDLFQFIENFEIVSQFAKHVGLRLLPEELQTIQAWVTRKEIDDKLLCALREIPLLEIAHEASEDADVRCLPVSQEVREKLNPKLIVSQLLVCPLNSDPQNVTPCVEALAKSSAEIIHLKTQFNAEKGYYESVDILPACYERLLVKSLHSQVTLIANGIKSPADLGIATMLGAGAVVIDRAALVALNYEFPMLEKKGEVLPEIEIEYGIQKLQNLFNSWHKQIREVLGAFGVRDIRRTVGERGRLIDLREREIKMRSIVEDAGLREASNVVNKAKILEDEDLARKASWTFSGLSKLVKPVSPPNENLSGDRSQSLKSMLEVRGDRRWNAEMLSATWMMASGQVPSHKVPQTGCDFGGGSFDVMRFAPVQVEGKILSLDGAVEDVYRKVQAGD